MFQCQRLFYKLEYDLHVFFLNSKPEGQYFAVNWVKSFIVSVERKSCNSSFSIYRCFGCFLKSVWVGKRDGFIIFSKCIVGIGCKFQFNLFLLPFKIYLSSKCLMQRTEFFVGNQLFRLDKLYPFFYKIGFSKRKRKCGDFFTVCITSTRTAKCHTFVKPFLLDKNITKIL